MYDHKDVEAKITRFWEERDIFEKSIHTRPAEKQYVFYDGPPFATGLPHYGHILGLTSKDLFPRFWTMRGYRVERRWGWDCHGLPIETIAEQDLGIREKRQIEEMGVAAFNEACRSKVLHFVQEWKKTVVRMGKWIEFDNSYKTMDNSYMESVWWIFKKLYDEKYVYRGKKVLLYCARCETPLAASEIAMDNSYRTIAEKTATVKFKVKDDTSTFILAWTTTPWTLLGNVALAINPSLRYIKVKLNNEFLILAKERIGALGKDKYVIIDEFMGEKLINKEYEPLFPMPAEKKGHYIINGGENVSAEEGTGVVHMALYGEFDYEMVKKYDLPIVQHLDKQGKVHQGPAEIRGLWFKKADEKVLENLERRHLLHASEPFTHSCPHCYRCNTPLFYNALDSWFVDIQRIKKRLLAKNADIRWCPEHIKDGRFRHVLETAPDWTISRNRFWATAMPIWSCESCNHITVVGSIKELQQKAMEKIGADIDLHKHTVDNIRLRCEKCRGRMKRIPEVFDCWFESGSMPYAAKHYPFENKEWFASHYPADFVSEYIAQVRTWFYYMHVLGVILFDKPPFKNVVVTGTVLAEDGSKMSKSKGNSPDPHAIFDLYGADALRFYLMGSPLMRAEDLNFNEQGVREVYRKVIMLLYNVLQFYEMYKGADSSTDYVSSSHVLDRWIISRLQVTIKEATNALEEYNTVVACNAIASFVDDLSLWYVRRSRDRFVSKDKKKREEAAKTLAHVLLTITKLIAPIMPFLSEEIYRRLGLCNKKLGESIHLEVWPIADNTLISEILNEDMKKTREIVSKALEERSRANIPVRQPLTKLEVKGLLLPGECAQLIKEEINVKEVSMSHAEKISIKLDTRITPDLEKEGYFRELTRRIQAMRKHASLKKEDRILLYIKSSYDLRNHADELKEKVGASSVVYEKAPKGQAHEAVKIKNEEFLISFTKV